MIKREKKYYLPELELSLQKQHISKSLLEYGFEKANKFELGGRKKSMNNVIFLDIDGVLNSDFWNDIHQKELSDGTLIDREKVALLGELVRTAQAKIVLHSGWRFWFDENTKPIRTEASRLADMLKAEDIAIYDVTPDFTTEEIRRTKKFSQVKAKEIFGWLDAHTDVDSWIVIDDLDLHDDTILKHQIKTDPSTGLTRKDIEETKKMLAR